MFYKRTIYYFTYPKNTKINPFYCPSFNITIMNKICTLVLLLGCITFSNAQTFQENLQSAVTASWQKSGLPGVSITVSTPDNRMVYASAGVGNVLTKSAIIPSVTQYRIASATKNFVAVLIMRLQEAGYFDINDKLAKHLVVPGLPNAYNITIKQLLEHSSAVGDYLNESKPFIEALTPDRIFTDTDIIGYLDEMEPHFTPGCSYEYSNGGYFVLGMLIEKKTGKRLDVAIQEWICNPLDLKNTFMDFTSDTTHKIPNLAEGTRAYSYSPTSVKAAGAIVSTTEDLAKYCKAIYGGNYLSKKSIEAMTTHSEVNENYGLGTRLFTSENKIKYHGHTGTILGYNSLMYYIPALDISVAITTNAYADPSSLWKDVRNAVYNTVEQEYFCGANVTAPTGVQLGE